MIHPELMVYKKPSGREKSAITYSATEHAALLPIISEVPDAFNASESSPQWQAVYQ
jgi:hypothetical protein